MLEVVIGQGAIIPCGLCRIALTIEDVKTAIREHLLCRYNFPDDRMDEWAALSNQAYVHKECADEKTNGKPHTSLGSDAHIKAKSRRLRGEVGQNRVKAKIQSRGFGAPPGPGRPKADWKSAAFRKDLRRKMNGKVVDKSTGKEVGGEQ